MTVALITVHAVTSSVQSITVHTHMEKCYKKLKSFIEGFLGDEKRKTSPLPWI